MKALHRAVFKAVAALGVVAAGCSFAVHADDPPSAKPDAPSTDAERVLDLNKLSIPVDISGMTGTDGKDFLIGHSNAKAWAAKVATGNPRSPAAEDGVVVVGSGGGAQVYGYDAATGKRNWTATSKDSGISNIVISLGHAYYTTYSCTLERVNIADGKTMFSEYLAPTVDCAPSACDDFVAAAYHKGADWNVSVHGHDRGAKRWVKTVGQKDVLTAPVIQDEDVFIACADGKVSKLDSHTGMNNWSAFMGAVSAPVPTPWGLLVTTTWDGKGGSTTPAAKAKSAEERKRRERETVTENEAEPGTLVAARDRRIALVSDFEESPTTKPADEVSGPRATLDFQGLRPGVSGSHVIFAYAGQVVCVDPKRNEVAWQVKVTDDRSDFVRPVCHEGLVFAASQNGSVCALEESTGAMIWAYEFKNERFQAEPAASENRLFLTTASGKLISMPIGLENIDLGKPEGSVNGVEGTAATYWKVQQAFRRVRNVVREIQEEPAKPKQQGPNARNGNGPDNSAPDNDAGNRDAAPNREEEEELTKGQWERREDRRAERAKAQGKKYEKQPYKRG